MPFALCLFNHFVRPRQHVRRNRQSDLFGGFEVDRELELCRLFDGKSAGLASSRILSIIVAARRQGSARSDRQDIHLNLPTILDKKRTSPELLGLERKPVWVSDDFVAQINIEIGPIEVAGCWFFYIQNFSHRHILKPWKMFIGHEQLVVAGQQPNAMF
jgi:hypothetical protein